jgi:hypothetical protein
MPPGFRSILGQRDRSKYLVSHGTYCLNSTTGQPSREDRIRFNLSPIGSVMTDLSIPSVEMKKAERGSAILLFLDAIFARAAEAGLRPDQYHVGFGARPGR